jgi:hypothetical protein
LGISANTKTYAQKEEWDEYINYNLGIRFEYPVSWEFSKPDTNDGKNHDFSLIDTKNKIKVEKQQFPIKIELGKYNTSIENDVSLMEWTTEYEANIPIGDKTKKTIKKNDHSTSSGKESIQRIINTPNGEFESVNIRRGNEVWYIWTNGDINRK